MKIGDKVLTEEVENQSEHKWVVLSPLNFDDNDHVIGGTIHSFVQTKAAAEKKASQIRKTGNRALVVDGYTPETVLSIGEVFVS